MTNDSEATSPPVPSESVGQEESQDGVTVPEEFQQQTHQLVHKANKHQLAHVRDRVYAREDELRNEEAKSSGKEGSKSKGPEIMSSSDMPE